MVVVYSRGKLREGKNFNIPEYTMSQNFVNIKKFTTENNYKFPPTNAMQEIRLWISKIKLNRKATNFFKSKSNPGNA
jgi:hypothetical protein